MSLSGNLGFQSLFSDTIGGMPEDQQTISPSRAKAKWNHNLRGIEIIQLGSTYPGMEVHCIEDYLTIYKAGHTYIRSADNSKWIDTTQKKHVHFYDTDEDGGELHHIEIANAGTWIRKNYDPVRSGDFYAETLGGEGINNYGSMIMSTNEIGGNYYQLKNGGNQISFEDEMRFFMRFELITKNSKYSSFRCGVNCEDVWEISSIRRMYGVEWCDDVNQDKTYICYSSDGSERNGVVTSLSANNASDIVHAIQLQYFPAQLIKMIYDGSNVLVTKGDSIPRTLSTNAVDTLKFGLKTNENADKQYRLRSVRLVGKAALDYNPW